MLAKIKHSVSLFLKEKVLKHYLIPFSRTECEPALVKFLPKKKITYIDVGSSTGEFANSVQKYFGFRKAVLIDPIPNLEKKIKIDPAKIRFEQCALSNKEKTQNFYLHKFHYSSSLLKNQEEEILKKQKPRKKVLTIKVKVKTLDKIYDNNFQNEKIDLLKIDVQGNELKVLQGAKKSLQKINYIFLEISFLRLYKKSATFFEIDKHLKTKGFYLLSIHEGYRGPHQELLQGDALYKRKEN